MENRAWPDSCAASVFRRGFVSSRRVRWGEGSPPGPQARRRAGRCRANPGQTGGRQGRLQRLTEQVEEEAAAGRGTHKDAVHPGSQASGLRLGCDRPVRCPNFRHLVGQTPVVSRARGSFAPGSRRSVPLAGFLPVLASGPSRLTRATHARRAVARSQDRRSDCWSPDATRR